MNFPKKLVEFVGNFSNSVGKLGWTDNGRSEKKAAAAEQARRNRKLPDNLQLLHDGETNYRAASVAAIEADPVLMDHVVLIEAVMEYIHYFSQRPQRDPDHEIIQLLSKRAFNDLASAHGLMLRGYYQTAAALLRDIIETADLVHYFRHKPEEIDVWRKSDHSTRLSQFGPRIKPAWDRFSIRRC